jgi:hypothetical protein
MWFFGLMFWCAVFMFIAMTARRRRWRRWAMMGPPGYYPVEAWYPRGWYRSRPELGAPATRQRETEDQQAYIETLESRISQLEERLDFTERLLEGRRGEATGK